MTPDRAPDVLTLDFEAETAPNARYVDLHNLLHNDKGKRVARRKLQNNTYAERMADKFGRPAVGVRFHDTFVVVNSAFTITLDTGGFGTLTTRERINRYTPDDVTVWTDKGSWMVGLTSGALRESAPFFDGMTLHWSAGGWSFEPDVTDDLRATMSAHNTAIRVVVEAWLNDLPEELADAREENGESMATRFYEVKCASCCFVDRQETRTIADEFDNHEHLLRHMIDRQWPAQLIAVAMREARMEPPNGLWFHNWNYNSTVRAEGLTAMKRALRHYVLSRLLTGVVTRSGYAPTP